MMGRLGTPCKWISSAEDINGIAKDSPTKKFNTQTTTITWLNNNPDKAEQRLLDIALANITALKLLAAEVAAQPSIMHMLRMGSDILPAYTETSWSWFWQQADIKKLLEQQFAELGEILQKNSIKSSFHPGQFCCIVSDKPDVVDRSLAELEYHAAMARMMNFGKSKLDFKINVHLSGKLGAAGFDAAWQRMSPELRNCLTIENDEYQAGIDAILPLSKYVGIVLDVHHHFINSGEYFSAADPRISQICDSWCGVRPTMHYSQSNWEYLSPFEDCLPSLEQLVANVPRGRLRSHSDFYNHRLLNAWALEHLNWADIMCESKSKNLGVQQLIQQLESISSIFVFP